jgi:hypothetical protein
MQAEAYQAAIEWFPLIRVVPIEFWYETHECLVKAVDKMQGVLYLYLVLVFTEMAGIQWFTLGAMADGNDMCSHS